MNFGNSRRDSIRKNYNNSGQPLNVTVHLNVSTQGVKGAVEVCKVLIMLFASAHH